MSTYNAGSHVYLGPWINFGKGGAIRGATLTLTDRDGGLLTSFIATFVTLTGAQLWKIICFTIHQLRSTARPRDALYHQQQAIWRNTNGPGGIAWNFLTQSWFWKGKARSSWIRTVSWSLFATIYVVLFGLLAVFSSEISKSPGPERLLLSDFNTCGYWAINASSPNGTAALSAKTANDSLVALAYAKACYGGSNDPLRCGRFAQPNIAYTTAQNVTCPFNSSICRYGENSAYQVTSKIIDSQLDLGINTPEHGRLGFQKQTTCAIIRQKGHAGFVTDILDNGDGSFTNVTDVYYYFGPQVDKDNPDLSLNFTSYVDINAFRMGIGYSLDLSFAWSNQSQSGWVPIEDIFQETADLSLLFLAANSIEYTQPVDDPWFSAHDEESLGGGSSLVWYTSDYFASTLGCTEQYRFINPNNGLATEWYGYLQLFDKVIDVNDDAYHLGWNALQQSMFYRFTYGAQFGNLQGIVYSQGAGALRASDYVNYLTQIPLPDNQWELEINGFFEDGMASMQQHAVEYATGPSNVTVGARLFQPAIQNKDLWSDYMCHNQIVLENSSTMSFSILGMSVLFIVGGLIILVSLIVERVVAFVQKRFKVSLHAQRAWVMDDKLHLQKGLFERLGMGKWKEGDEDLVPTTTTKEEFARFEQHHLFSPNSPDTPDGAFAQKTEYMGAHGKVSEVPLYPAPGAGYHYPGPGYQPAPGYQG